MSKKFFPISFLILTVFLFACKHEVKTTDPVPQDGNYPPEVANIIITKCATSGCHNALSYQNAGGLLLDTWEHMFNGGSNGAAVVAYSTDNSPLLYFINTDPSLGLVNQPTMPYNSTPLSTTEYNTIKNWIAAGAPDKNGNVPFASNPDTRQKFYLGCQGSGACKLVAVIDAEKKVVMRYIKIGEPGVTEIAHNIRVSADGKFAYVCFIGGRYVQKIDTRTDSIVASADLGANKQWSVINLSPDGKKLMVSDWEGSGSLSMINTESMTLIQNFPGLTWPHGIASCPTYDTFYTPSQYGNQIYKFNLDGSYFKTISVDGNPLTTSSILNVTPDPHDIFMLPDHSKYFLTCENTNEVRVMDSYADTVIKVFHIGKFPQELTISKTKPYVFVTCMEDTSAFPLSKGSVYIFDYQQLSFVKRIDASFYQPHGIAVDDQNGVFYVVSRNFDPTGGPAPHHSSECGKNNGWYQVFDLTTLQPYTGRRYEVTPDPYFIDARFK